MVSESEFKTRFGAYIPLFLPNTKLATEVFTTSPRNCVIVLHEFRGVLWECYHTVWCKYAICKNFTPYHLSIYLSIRFITSLFMDLKKKKPLTRQRSGVQILPTHPSHNSMHHNQSRIVSFAWRRHRACEKVLRVQSICPMDSSVCERLWISE